MSLMPKSGLKSLSIRTLHTLRGGGCRRLVRRYLQRIGRGVDKEAVGSGDGVGVGPRDGIASVLRRELARAAGESHGTGSEQKRNRQHGQPGPGQSAHTAASSPQQQPGSQRNKRKPASAKAAVTDDRILGCGRNVDRSRGGGAGGVGVLAEVTGGARRTRRTSQPKFATKARQWGAGDDCRAAISGDCRS